MIAPAFLGIHDTQLSAAVVSVLTALAVVVLTLPLKEWARLFIESKLYERKADTDYLYEQRKALSETIAHYHGGLIDAADRFCHRLVRIEKHFADGWLDPDRPTTDRYFYESTIYRFLIVAATADALERRGLVVDRRVGRSEDQRLIWYARAFRWSLTGAELFDGTGYDPERESEHFFTDTLRDVLRQTGIGPDAPGFGVLRTRLRDDPELESIRRFFGRIEPGQRRWDRLMVSRLILMGLLNTYGDDVQSSSQEWFDDVARLIVSDQIAANFSAWLPRFKLACTSIELALAHRPSTPTPVTSTG